MKTIADRTVRNRIVYVVALLVGLGAGLSACNTVEGLGKDITAAGKSLSKATGNN